MAKLLTMLNGQKQLVGGAQLPTPVTSTDAAVVVSGGNLYEASMDAIRAFMSSNIDGGNASSTYVASQVIDGGGA